MTVTMVSRIAMTNGSGIRKRKIRLIWRPRRLIMQVLEHVDRFRGTRSRVWDRAAFAALSVRRLTLVKRRSLARTGVDTPHLISAATGASSCLSVVPCSLRLIPA